MGFWSSILSGIGNTNSSGQTVKPLNWFENHQLNEHTRKTGCPATHGKAGGLFGAWIYGNCGKSI